MHRFTSRLVTVAILIPRGAHAPGNGELGDYQCGVGLEVQ
jgi:hypothetical protein